MDIKEQIGGRITKARKELGITIKELAARTGTLSAARISNWEQGTRKPDPVAAKALADILKVSASYLMCLTDNPQGDLSSKSGRSSRLIPVLTMQDISSSEELLNPEAAHPQLPQEVTQFIILDELNKQTSTASLFAVVIDDNSMQPDLNPNDLVIINRERAPCPGDFVLAYSPEKKQTVLRKYGETENCLFQLIPSNSLWAAIQIKNIENVLIIGVVCEHRRYL